MLPPTAESNVLHSSISDGCERLGKARRERLSGNARSLESVLEMLGLDSIDRVLRRTAQQCVRLGPEHANRFRNANQTGITVRDTYLSTFYLSKISHICCVLNWPKEF